MVRAYGAVIIIFLICGISFLPGTVLAGGLVKTDVRVIHASGGPKFIDDGIRDLAQELDSVFKYTSYRLINANSMDLGSNQKGLVRLPGKRSMVVIPINISGNRIKYNIGIFKSKKQIFQTQIMLRNNSSITIGGPKFKNGYLLFNISGKIL